MNGRLLRKCFIAASVFIGALTQTAEAQLTQYLGGVKLLVNSPNSLYGTRTNTNNIGSTTWGIASLTPFFNVQVIKVVDSLACPNTVVNGQGSVPGLVGKVALLYRGNCQFGEKALQAQNLGAIAVIIVNNVAGEPAGMAGGTVGMNVTIPVFMVSKADGDQLNAAINGGNDVYVSATSWGFGFAHDLTLADQSAPPPHALTMPFNQFLPAGSQQPDAYRLYNGGYPINVGTSDESGVVMESEYTFTPAGGSSTLVWKDTIQVGDFPVSDSVIREFNSRSFGTFGASTKGTLVANHTVSSSSTDEQPSDNKISYTMTLTDTIFSKGRYDFTNNVPLITGGIRLASTATDLTWGPLYYVRKGAGWRADKLQFSVTINGRDTTMFGQRDVFVTLFKWEDVDNDGIIRTGLLANGGELKLVGQQVKVFAVTDSVGDVFTVNLEDVNGGRNVQLEDNSWYWAAVEIDNSNCFLGVDGSVNYSARAWGSFVATTPGKEEYYAPLISQTISNIEASNADTLNMLPFVSAFRTLDSGFTLFRGNNSTPNVAMHISDKAPVSVSVHEIQLNAADVAVYPNPVAGESINVDVNFSKNVSKASFRVVNATGSTQYIVDEYNVGRRRVALPTSKLVPGLYYVVITGEGSNSVTKQFVVTR